MSQTNMGTSGLLSPNPDGTAASNTNVALVLSDNPSAPDSFWYRAQSQSGSNNSITIRFTPPPNMLTNTTQSISLFVRRNVALGSTTPITSTTATFNAVALNVDLMENGVVLTSGANLYYNAAFTNSTGFLITTTIPTAAFNAISDKAGPQIDLRISAFGGTKGGSTTTNTYIDVGAVMWQATSVQRQIYFIT